MRNKVAVCRYPTFSFFAQKFERSTFECVCTVCTPLLGGASVKKEPFTTVGSLLLLERPATGRRSLSRL